MFWLICFQSPGPPATSISSLRIVCCSPSSEFVVEVPQDLYLKNAQFTSHDNDPMHPTQTEVEIHGYTVAEEIAHTRFFQNASNASLLRIPFAMNCYEDAATRGSIRGKIELALILKQYKVISTNLTFHS